MARRPRWRKRRRLPRASTAGSGRGQCELRRRRHCRCGIGEALLRHRAVVVDPHFPCSGRRLYLQSSTAAQSAAGSNFGMTGRCPPDPSAQQREVPRPRSGWRRSRLAECPNCRAGFSSSRNSFSRQMPELAQRGDIELAAAGTSDATPGLSDIDRHRVAARTRK